MSVVTTAFCTSTRAGPQTARIYPATNGHDTRAGTLTLVATPLSDSIDARNSTAPMSCHDVKFKPASSLPLRQTSRLPVFAQITDEEHRRQSQLLLARLLLEEFSLLLVDLRLAHSRYLEQLAMLEKQRISPFRLQNAEGLVVNKKATSYAFETITMADQLISRTLACQSILRRCIIAAGRLEIGLWSEGINELLRGIRQFLYTRHWSVSADATRVVIKTAGSAFC
ncbi:hypothetical protein BDF22DRAFT_657336 [Syncephalis plumigaleata]|nr:hypothetical protein BDF22DRAFT_657336 [Syncephalis plumigaleata]